MKRINTYILLITALLFFSCSEKAPTEPEESYSGEVISIQGKIQFEYSPANSNEYIHELNVLSYSEEDDVNSDNTFDIDIIDSNEPQMVFGVTEDDDLVLSTLVLPGANSVVLSEKTTANTFILINPIFMFVDESQTREILDTAPNCASYNSLVSSVASVIHSDPQNVYDATKHPELIELAAQVGYEILANLEGGAAKANANINGIGATAPTVEIDKNNTGRVVFKNPNFVALSAEVLHLDTYEKEKIFSLAPRPKLIRWKLGIPPCETTPPTSRTIDFAKDDAFTILATKGFNFSLPSNEWISPSTANGRATILNLLVITRQIVRYFIPGLVEDFAEKAVNEVRVNLSESQHALSNLKSAVKNKEVKQAAKYMYEVIRLNKYAFLSAVGATGAIIKRKSIASLMEAVADFCPYLKWFSAGYLAANETIPIFTDLLMGERTFNYYVVTDYSGDVTAAYEVDYENPLAPHVSLDTWTEGVIRRHYHIKVKCYTEEFAFGRYKYKITNKEYGNSIAVWETGFTTPTKTYEFETEYMDIGKKAEFEFTVNKGTHELNVYAIDEEGNKSPASKTHKKRTVWW